MAEQPSRQNIQEAIRGLRGEIEDRLQRSSADLLQLVEQVASGVPELPAPAPAPPTATGVVALRDALAAIDSAESQAEVLARLLEQATGFASRAALFLTGDDGRAELRGWSGIGFDGSAVEGLSIAVPAAKPWPAVLAGHGTLRLSAADCAPLCSRIEATLPRAGALVPLVLRDRVSAVLYADQTGEQPLSLEALQLLTHSAAQTLEIIPLRRSQRSPTLTEGAAAVEPRQPVEPAPPPVEPTAPAVERPPEAPPAAGHEPDPPTLSTTPLAAPVEPPPPAPPMPVEGTAVPAAAAAAPTPIESAAPAPVEELSAVEPQPAPAMPEPQPPPSPVVEPPTPAATPPPAAEGPPAAPAAAEAILTEGERQAGFVLEPIPSAPEQPAAAPTDLATGAVPAPPPPEPEVSATEATWELESGSLLVEPTLTVEPPAPAAPPPSALETVGGLEPAVPELASPLEGRPASALDELQQAQELADLSRETQLIPQAGLPLQAPPPIPPAAPPVPEPPPGEAAISSGEVVPPSDIDGPGWAFAGKEEATPGGDEPLHEEARRLARLLVSEIKLYNEELIAEGKRQGNIYLQLQEDIDRSRQMYEERIDEQVRRSSDYFRDELIRSLAGGDASVMGL